MFLFDLRFANIHGINDEVYTVDVKTLYSLTLLRLVECAVSENVNLGERKILIFEKLQSL